MFQKAKYLLVGLIAGLILATAGYALADSPIRLVVNGKEIASDPAPIMYQDRVFVPIRFVAEALGADVAWDEATQTVTVASKVYENDQTVPGPLTPEERDALIKTFTPVEELPHSSQYLGPEVNKPDTTITPEVEEPAKEPAKEGSNIQTYEKDGYVFIIDEDGVEYYPLRWVGETIRSKTESGTYSIRFNVETRKIYMTYNDDPYGNTTKTVTVLENIPSTVFNYQSYVSKSYYESTILPLVE